MISPSDELLIRKTLATTIASATGFRTNPAPVYFNDKEDFFSTDESVVEADKNTQDEIELEDVKSAWVYLKGFEDSQTSAPDSPEVSLNYEIVLFHQYDHEREDEAETPDAFNKKLLLAHNVFIAAVLNLKAAFQGVRNLGVLNTTTYVDQKTNSLVIIEEIENRSECVFIPRILGHSITFREEITLRLREC